MGFFNPFKKSRREVNRSNQSQGKDGEDQIRRKYEFNGYKVERTGKGHDLKATKRNWFTGKKEKPIYVEVKTGGSKLSKLQKIKKRQFGKRYVEERLEPTVFGLTESGGMFSTRDSSGKKKPRSSGYDSLWGTGSSSKPKKSRSSGYDSLFGTGSSSKPKKSRSSGYDSLFGTGSSSKPKKSRSSGYDSLFGTGSSRKKKKSSGIW